MLRSLLSAILPQSRRDHLLIACMPKSGSTYLHTVLQEITGLGEAYASEWGEQNEGDICERRLRRLRRRSLMHHHMKATQTNLKWMLKFGLRPIVQTRSLFDVLPSIHDHLEQRQGGLPSGYDDREFWSRGWNDRLEFLIHMHLPWYFNFLLSWREAASAIEICPISYEELFADQVGSLARILNFYKISASRERISAAIARASRRNTRFNVGGSGRGNRVLTSGHKQAIRKLAVVCGFELSEKGCVAEPFFPRQSTVPSCPTVAPLRNAA